MPLPLLFAFGTGNTRKWQALHSKTPQRHRDWLLPAISSGVILTILRYSRAHKAILAAYDPKLIEVRVLYFSIPYITNTDRVLDQPTTLPSILPLPLVKTKASIIGKRNGSRQPNSTSAAKLSVSMPPPPDMLMSFTTTSSAQPWSRPNVFSVMLMSTSPLCTKLSWSAPPPAFPTFKSLYRSSTTRGRTNLPIKMRPSLTALLFQPRSYLVFCTSVETITELSTEKVEIEECKKALVPFRQPTNHSVYLFVLAHARQDRRIPKSIFHTSIIRTSTPSPFAPNPRLDLAK